MTNPKDIIGKGKKSKAQSVEEQDNPDTKIDEMPTIPEAPEIDKVKPKRKIPNSMEDLKAVINSINSSNVEEITDTIAKNTSFESAARDLWIIKESEKPYFDIKMKIPIDPKAKVIRYQRDKDGRPLYTTKRFYYGGLGIPEKDVHSALLMEREYAKFELSQIAVKLRTNPTADIKLKFMRQTNEIYKTVQNYNRQVFKDYFGATDAEINLMNIDDIINYNDVAVYIEGTKHPQSD